MAGRIDALFEELEGFCADSDRTTPPVFVGREDELAKLELALELARRLVDEVDARSANFPHHLAVGLLAACETLCANRDQYGPTNDLLPEIVDAGETVDREEAGLLLAIAEARGVLRKTVRKGVGTFFELPTIPSAAGGAMPLRHPRIEALHGAPAWGPCMGGDLPKWIKSAKRRQRQKEECRFGV